ncbi:MAG: MXAN_5187 C-terminal domain-containing protein [Deltaproteobacteria bacterium]|nr:MXAN_5187 C-terminal domain-containing protein [Deltaproteobacteria bacterium]
MLLTRFWFLLLSAVAVVAISFGMLVRGAYQADRGKDAETLLAGDRRQIEEYLRTDARVRLDTLRELSTSADFARLMNQARERTSDATLRDVATRIQQQLTTLNNRLEEPTRSHVLIAVDPRGMVVGRDGFNASQGIGDYLGGLPLVSAALNGYLRDDAWALQGSLYRMAAVPVIYQGRYVGALLGGRTVDDVFVTRISDALAGATVGFFSAGHMEAAHDGVAERGRPAVRGVTLGEMLPNLGRDDASRPFNTRGYTDVMSVDNGQGAAVFGKIPGMVGLAGGGFVVARPKPVLPSDFLLHPPGDLAKSIKWGPLIGFGVSSFVLAMLWLFIEHDNSQRKLKRMLTDLATRKIERLDPLKLPGAAKQLALAINEAFESAMKAELARTASAPKRAVAEDIDSLLGSGGGSGMGMAPGMSPPPRPGGPPPRPGSAPVMATGSSMFVSAADLVGGDASKSYSLFTSPVEEQAHWREIYSAFIAERKKNGENIDGLTFEKLSGTLERNKKVLVDKTQCRSVRFVVHTKDGKAALRATPIR